MNIPNEFQPLPVEQVAAPRHRLCFWRTFAPDRQTAPRIVWSRLTSLFLAGVVAAVVTGCKVGPDYQSPNASVPGRYTSLGLAALSNLTSSVTSNVVADPLASWWTLFKDPTLESLVADAVAANHDVRLAQARVREARALRGGARSSLFPQVHGSADYQRSRSSGSTSQGKLSKATGAGLTQDNWLSGLDLSWEIDVFGGNQRAVEAAQAGLEAAADRVNGTRITVLAEVGLGYLDVRGLQKQLAVARDNLLAQEQTLALTRDRAQAGLANELDSARAEAQVAATAALIPPLEQGMLNAQHRLATLLGKVPGELAKRLEATSLIPAPAPTIPVGLPSDLLRRRPDIRRAERELAAATARVGVATAELFPKFYLTGAAGLQSIEANDFFDGGSRFWSLGPSLRWPIFSAGRIRQKIQVENARQEQAVILYEQTVLKSLEEVENALVAFGKEQERHRELIRAEQASRRAVTLASDQFRSGLVDFLSVLEAQRTQFAAQEQLVRSEQALSQNAVRLYQALGGGWHGLQSPKSLVATTANPPSTKGSSSR
ncbi:MAG: efflux transporter outer membrane subunit [Verrucomicrobia bacterium]|nr:efflux transporter outer membrane subunit [Verrucomicrobiota bacterium]